MDFVHCNLCFNVLSALPKGPNPRFLLTSCGHIYCSQCVDKVSQDSCHVCQRTFSTVELNAELQADVASYFQDPLDLLEKASQIAKFQQSQRMRLFHRLSTSHAKYIGLKSETMKVVQENNRLRKENKHLELRIGHYKSQLLELKKRMKFDHLKTPNSGNGSDFLSVITPGPSSQRPSQRSSQIFHNDRENSQMILNSSGFNQYRGPPQYSPTDTMSPIPESPYASSRTPQSGSLTRSSCLSSGGNQFMNSGNGYARTSTPREIDSPNVLRPLNFQYTGTSKFKRP